MCSADCSRTNFGQADISDLTCLDQILHGSDGVLYGSLRIEAVLVIKIDVIGSQPPQRTFDRRFDMSGTAVEPEYFPAGPEFHRELCCNDHILPPLAFDRAA